jgi:hypothetical protein
MAIRKSSWRRRGMALRPDRARRQPRLETLETRTLLTGTWTKLTNPFPNGDGAETMLLLSDGTVMANGGQAFASKNWYRLTPDSMGSYVNGTWSPLADSGLERLYYASDVLTDGRVFVAGGEYTGANTSNTDDNTGQIYDPATNTWKDIANYPDSLLGDAVSETLPDGRVIAGNNFNGDTFIFNPATNKWTPGPSMPGSDTNSESGWVKLGDGSTLAYMTNDGQNSDPQMGLRLVTGATDAQDQWVNAGSVPVALDSSGGGPISPELGPSFLLPDGRVFWVGASQNTALYSPPAAGNPTGTWTAGPLQTDPGGNPIGAFDAPGAIEPNGKVIWAAGQINGNLSGGFGGPINFLEFDPKTSTITNVGAGGPQIGSGPFTSRMLVLPSGQIMFTSGVDSDLWVYTPDSAPNSAWAPTISSIAFDGNGKYTLTGTQINGLNQGAAYGDDAQMASNYPIIKLVDSNGNVSFATTSNWSSNWVATGSTPETTDFTLPASAAPGTYTLSVIANGIESQSVTFHTAALVLTPATLSNVDKDIALSNVVVATFTDQSGTHPLSDYSATLDWGDGLGQDTVGTVVNSSPAGTFAIEGSHTYKAGGVYNLTITLTNKEGFSATGVVKVHVLGSTVSGGGVEIDTVEGAQVNQTIGTFNNGDPLAQASDFTATIDWGDSTGSDTGRIVADPNGGFDVGGSHVYAEEGDHSAVITVLGPDNSKVTITDPVSVLDAPLTPTGLSIAVKEGTTFSGDVASFTDGNPGASISDFTVTINWGDGSAPDTTGTVVQLGGGFVVRGSHTYAAANPNVPITVTINDTGGATTTAKSTATVSDVAIQLTGVPIEATEGTAATVIVGHLTDADSLATTSQYTVTIDWNDGSAIDTSGIIAVDAAGGFNITGTHTYADEGTHDVRIKVLDQGGALASVLSSVTVDDATVTSTPVSFGPTEGQAFAGQVAHFTDANPTAPLADFSATVDWGDGAISPGTIAANPAGGFDVTAGHTFADEGSYLVQVVIDDVGGNSASFTESINVADAAVKLSLIPFGAVEGTAVNGTVATFSDANPGGKLGDFSATIDWGDGIVSPGTITGDAASGFSVSGTHGYEEGTYPNFTVTVADVGGSLASQGSTVVVSDAVLTGSALTITTTEGQTYDGAVANFTDADSSAPLSDFTANINWGDGTKTNGSIAFVGGQYVVSGSHSFEEGKNTPVTVTVNDVGGSNATINSTANVADAPILVTVEPFSAQEGIALPTGTVVAHFVDLNGTAPIADYAGSTINWGDGKTSPATIQADTTLGGYDVIGSHTFEEGTDNVSVTINDVGGSTASSGFILTVSDAPLSSVSLPISATEGTLFNGQVATITDTNPTAPLTDFAATIDWGDGATSVGTITISSTKSGGTQLQVQGSHSFEDGTHLVTTTVTDVGGSSTKSTALASITDAPLTIRSTSISASEGVTFTGNLATFTDAYVGAQASDYTATIDWHDGTTSAGTITALTTGGFGVVGSHTYEEGTYAATVTVTDKGGSTAFTTNTFQVADAPLANVPLLNALVPKEGVPLSVPVADFTDGNPKAPASDFTATIDWGDGSTSPGLIAADGTGGFFVSDSGTHTYESSSTAYTIAVTVNDVGGQSLTTKQTFTVPDAPVTAAVVPFSPQEGVSYTGPVATFSDGNPNAPLSDFTATITWGDGATTTGTIAALGRGKFSLSGTHTYTEEQSPTVAVAIADKGGSQANTQGGITVFDASVTGVGALIQATEKVPFSGLVGTFQDANTGAPASDFQASIDWGDGTTTVGTVTALGNGGFGVNGSHTYATSGTYPTRVTLTDKGGTTATASSTTVAADLLYPLTGSLNPASNTGAAFGVTATRITQPNFTGTGEPGAVVQLFAQQAGGSPVLVGFAGIDGNGDWSITTVPLGDGSYTITALATEPGGKPSSVLTTLYPQAAGSRGPIVIAASTPPTVGNVSFDPTSGRFAITFSDALSPLVTGDLLNPGNYSLSLPSGRTARNFSLQGLTLSPSDPNTVLATFDLGRRSHVGGYVLTINSQGIADAAGNTLVEKVYTPFPSLNPPAGSNYVAQFQSNGQTSSGPQPYTPFSEVLAARNHSRFIRGRVSPRRRR